MKVAIVCDWLVLYAGAERVMEAMIECFPQASLYAVIDFLPQAQRDFLQGKPVQTTFIQSLPFAKKYYRAYLPWMPLAIEQLDISHYDLILSSSHAVAKGVLSHPNQLHISYIHSPMRYAWDMQHQYLTHTGQDKGIKSYIIRYLLHKVRLWDQRTANGVDYFIANSSFIARRIWKTYRRHSTVIYPPIDTQLFFYCPTSKQSSFYLTVARWVPYKRIDLIVESFKYLPKQQLIVIGDGPERKKITAVCPPNVTLLGFQPIQKLITYMQNAKALIIAAEEDCGIAVLEAQSCGTPIIALNKGGLPEIIRGLDTPKPTGMFFNDQTIPSLCEAIQYFSQQEPIILSENCRDHAQRFSKERFKSTLTAFITAAFDRKFNSTVHSNKINHELELITQEECE